MKKRISILGATGTIGRNTLDVASAAQQESELVALTGNENWQAMAELARKYRPECIAMADRGAAQKLKDSVQDPGIDILDGPEGVVEAAGRSADWTMAGIVGMAGLPATMAAIDQGGTVAFAAKECLAGAGPVLMQMVEKTGTTLLPVDSEHNALFQVYEHRNRKQIEKMILTASGGPFRSWTTDRIRAATPEQAVAHPNWTMGAKISVDSATMANKGLELIEAFYLFNLRPEQLEVLIHPQSLVHGMVVYADGSVLTQMGAPDMRTPIAHAFAWPDRMGTPGRKLDLQGLSTLDFLRPDTDRFPALRLAGEVLKTISESGHAAALIYNTANEEAVYAFLRGEISFPAIAETIEACLNQMERPDLHTLEAVLDFDHKIRLEARGFIRKNAA